MSTWTSRGRLVALGLALALAACAPPGEDADDGAPRRIVVAEGAVVVEGPRGFCVDRAASRAGAAGGLVVLGDCRVLGRTDGPGADPPAILTVAVAPPEGAATGLPAAEDLAAFFESARGRARLSRAGRAATVEIHSMGAQGRAFVIHLTDRARFPGGAVEPTYWRALAVINGRWVTLSAYAPAGRPHGEAEGRQLLRRLVQATMRASPG